MTDRDELTVEAVLFTMGDSVETRQLAEALGCEPDKAREAARRLKKRYDEEGRALQIIELEDCFQMCTRNEYYDALIKVVKTPRRQVLTDAVMETLSIIAYKQPVTRAQIEKIRGVSSDYAVNKLIEYGLVYEAGRLDVPGKPAAFATTEEFLRRFGVASKRDLPTLDADAEAEIIQEVAREIDYRPEEDGEPLSMGPMQMSLADFAADIMDGDMTSITGGDMTSEKAGLAESIREDEAAGGADGSGTGAGGISEPPEIPI